MALPMEDTNGALREQRDRRLWERLCSLEVRAHSFRGDGDSAEPDHATQDGGGVESSSPGSDGGVPRESASPARVSLGDVMDAIEEYGASCVLHYQAMLRSDDPTAAAAPMRARYRDAMRRVIAIRDQR